MCQLKKTKGGWSAIKSQACQFYGFKKCLRLADLLKCSYLRTKSIFIICGFLFCGPKFLAYLKLSHIRKCPLKYRLKKLFFNFAQYTKFCRTNLRPNFRGSMKGPRRGQTYIKKMSFFFSILWWKVFKFVISGLSRLGNGRVCNLWINKKLQICDGQTGTPNKFADLR